jgi:hypothetical protein
MHAGASKRYSHDGKSFRSFTPAGSWPHCAHFSVARRCGGETEAGSR